MDNDRIEVYKDETLLNLTQKMGNLSEEEVEIFLSDLKVTGKGRTREDIAKDMIVVYEETNKYLKNKYPDNAVANCWIGVNDFSAKLLKERLKN